MNPEDHLISPTLDLFVYYIAEGLGQTPDQIDDHFQNFAKKIYGKDIKDTQFQHLVQKYLSADPYVPLLGEGRDKIAEFSEPWDGYYYPVKLGDTYGLQLDCSGKLNEPEKKEISCLKEIKQAIKYHLKTEDRTTQTLENIGQSWLIWGQLTDPNQDVEKTAKNCYENLNLSPELNWDDNLQNQGKIAGATYFELWRSASDAQTIDDNYHTLIILFPHNISLEEAGKTIQLLYPNLMKLFGFRNKVIWAYQQTRQLKKSLKQSATKINQLVKELPNLVETSSVNLSDLQQKLANNLAIFSIYASYISSLEEQQQTAKTNLNNYKKELAKLPNFSLDITKKVQTFEDYAEVKYLPQIESDLTSLSAGLKLLDNCLKTIEGIINIEQAKSNYNLSYFVGVTGLGLGLTGATASIISSQISNIQDSKSIQWKGVGATWVISIGLGVLVVWVLIKFRSKIEKILIKFFMSQK